MKKHLDIQRLGLRPGWRARTVTFVVALVVLLPPLSDTAQAKRSPTYARDFEAFVKQVGKSYPFFDLKKIRKDWNVAKRELTKRARACKTDDEFILVVFEAIACLRDAHMTITTSSGKYPKLPKTYYPGISFLPAVGDRVIVMHPPAGKESRLKTGTVVTKIDGKPARKFLEDAAEAAWKRGGYFSSPQRARLVVYRTPLSGKKGEAHTISCLDGKEEKRIKLESEHELRGWPHTYNPPKGLQRVGRSFLHTKLQSGVGYMYWRRIDESVWQGIPKALAAHPDAKGWIVDLRGNGGGGYGRDLLGAMKSLTRPVAVILDAGCISAGETVARDLVALCEARLFGTTTAGSSTSKRKWEFPSGIATIRLSTRSRKGVRGKLIEFNGIEPNVKVEAVPEEVLAGKNTEILRAEEYVLDPRRRKRVRR